MRELRTWTAAAAVALTLLPLAANAEGTYVGFDYMMTTYDENGFPEIKPKAAAFKLGKLLNPHFAIEGRAGLGLSGDAIESCYSYGSYVYCADVELEVDSFLGMYARAIAPVSKNVSFYSLLGMTRGKLSASTGGGSFSASETDLSYGVGAEFLVGETTGLNLEYLQAIDKDGVEVSSLTVGLVFHY